jgi:DNA primase
MAEAWLRAAQRLKLGGKGRAWHGCSGSSNSPTLLISNDQDKWSGWCFRCHESVFEFKPKESFRERIERMRKQAQADEAISQSVALPRPINTDLETWPIEARMWLLKASVGRSNIKPLGAYHHAPTNRVVLPVIDAGRLLYWQARSIDGREPKYLGASIDKQHITARYGMGDPVLTEDILSAYRVGESGAGQGTAILGTSLNDKVLSQLIKQAKPVTVWLDPDGPGRDAARDIITRLDVVGLPHRQIITSRDPKLLSKGEITSLLTQPY